MCFSIYDSYSGMIKVIVKFHFWTNLEKYGTVVHVPTKNYCFEMYLISMSVSLASFLSSLAV